MTETVSNTLSIQDSFDVDFIGWPVTGEDQITTSFTVLEILEIETTNSVDDDINIRYNVI